VKKKIQKEAKNMKNASQQKQAKRTRRHARIRSQVVGTSERPRLCVFKSNKYISAQIINDDLGVTLAAASTLSVKGKGTELEKARALGATLAVDALKKNITKVVFDRGGYLYTGKVEALATGAREGGLSF